MVKDRYDKARKAFTFFFLKSGERVTTEQISKATGWSNGTVNDYYSKMWSRWSIMKKVRPGVYSVRIPANLTEDGFIYLHSQIHNSIDSLNKN